MRSGDFEKSSNILVSRSASWSCSPAAHGTHCCKTQGGGGTHCCKTHIMASCYKTAAMQHTGQCSYYNSRGGNGAICYYKSHVMASDSVNGICYKIQIQVMVSAIRLKFCRFFMYEIKIVITCPFMANVTQSEP